MEKGMNFPQRYNLFGINVAGTSYNQLANLVLTAGKNRYSFTVDHMPVHGLITGVRDKQFKKVLNGINIVAPDGQPVRWALNILYGAALKDRVYGPKFMHFLCGKAMEEGVGIYLYGSDEKTLEKLKSNLHQEFPSLQIAGAESPPFRQLTIAEDTEMIKRVNSSGAGIVFIGLGCPKQEVFAYEHRNSIKAAQICVGAAFDFIAKTKKTAPTWMQAHGLEWLYRLVSEPGRLWKRYLVTNTLFLVMFLQAYFILKILRKKPAE
jgi:exopolysaccharide biosynthesis WecB/TagA/CpsF family protein